MPVMALSVIAPLLHQPDSQDSFEFNGKIDLICIATWEQAKIASQAQHFSVNVKKNETIKRN